MAEAPQEKIIQLSELEGHNSRKSCWVAVDGKVYDITKYLGDHPGGPQIVMDASGKDATDDFEAVGHSASARKLMAEFLIGKLPEGQGVRVATAGSSSAASKASKGEGSGMMLSVLPILVLLALLYFQFVY